MPTAPPGFTLRNVLRSGFVLAGILFVAVGVGDVVAGRAKIDQYGELVATIHVDPHPDPTALFPAATEGEERRAVWVDKLAFYQLVVTAGQLLAAVGLGLVLVGLLRLRIRTPRTPAGMPLAN